MVVVVVVVAVAVVSNGNHNGNRNGNDTAMSGTDFLLGGVFAPGLLGWHTPVKGILLKIEVVSHLIRF